MAVLNIVRMGHPVLRNRAREVEDPAAPEIVSLVADMIETMHSADGVGLAAPQVAVPLRVVVYMVPPDRVDEGDGDDGGADGADEASDASGSVPVTVLINPEITPLDDETVSMVEGCLSLPGMMGLVPRWAHIRLAATDQHGQRTVRELSGFHARVVQHECDHLDGILYPQRMPDLTTFGYTDEFRRAITSDADQERSATDDQ